MAYEDEERLLAKQNARKNPPKADKVLFPTVGVFAAQVKKRAALKKRAKKPTEPPRINGALY